MKRILIHIILVLSIPALCQAGYRTDVLQNIHGSGLDLYRLEIETGWRTGFNGMQHIEIVPDAPVSDVNVFSLDKIHSGIPPSSKEAPGDMVSMVSFVWAELFGGVDIVAEVKEFAREVRHRRRYVQAGRNRSPDSRKRWKLIMAYRVDDQTEVAAHYNYRGSLFSGGNISLQISALDPVSEEVGLKMAYSGGELNIRADRMTLTERAEAKIKITF